MQWRSRNRAGRDLGGLSLFEGLRPSALAGIESLCTEVSVRPGRVLTVEGTVARQAFVIRSGQVAVSSADVDFETLSDGAVVGEMALLYGIPRCATTIALCETRLLVFTPGEFRALLEEPLVRKRVLELANTRREITAVQVPALREASVLPCTWTRPAEPRLAIYA